MIPIHFKPLSIATSEANNSLKGQRQCLFCHPRQKYGKIVSAEVLPLMAK